MSARNTSRRWWSRLPLLTGALALAVFLAGIVPLVRAALTDTRRSPALVSQVVDRELDAVRQRAPSTKSSSSKQASRSAATARVVSKPAASLGPLETIVESLNKCGPSSVSAVLAYWHVYRSQEQVQAVLRADNSYWGMSPVDLPVYAQSLGMRALVGYGGTEKQVKLLIANGFPVIASQYVSLSDPIRHYRPIEAYNDRTQTFVSADRYLGAGHVISYAEFNAIWAESDYRFQVVYPPSRQAQLNAILRAAGWNKVGTYSGAIRWEEAQMQTSELNVAGSWIWYNGYIDIAFDRAQIGQFKKANAALGAAARQGISPVLINWVRSDIRMLERNS
jgi:predicted double-glycine peptidase